MLDFEFHLVGFGEKCHHGGLVRGIPNVFIVDFQNAVTHAQLSSAGGGTTRNDLLNKNITVRSCFVVNPLFR